MEFIFKMLNLQIMLFILMAVGIVVKKVGIITTQNRKSFSNLLINVILPCNIVNSFLSGVEISSELFKNCLLAVVLSAVIQIFVTLANKLLFKGVREERKSVMSYGMICSNSSFIGLPVAESLYGSMGVLYTSLFQIPVRFTMWTAGLALFTDVDRKSAFKKLAKHPCIIAIFVGFILMMLPISLPEVMLNTISSISKCTTPISMFVIGAILADADIKTMFSKDVLYFTFLRLVGLPLFIWLVLKPFHLNSLLVSVCVIMSGMPAGSTTSILADQYGGDSMFASQMTFVSTLLSIVTIPILGLILG
jgi:malate permease and related proteins